jgi:uncharacterized membrane protein
MNPTVIRTLPAALVLACACIGAPATAQTSQPGTVQKAENAGEKAWDKTKEGSEKAWDATKSGSKKAVKATEKGAKATGKAVSNVASDAADGTRKVGDKIGEKIPGTVQNEAAKKP